MQKLQNRVIIRQLHNLTSQMTCMRIVKKIKGINGIEKIKWSKRKVGK